MFGEKPGGPLGQVQWRNPTKAELLGQLTHFETRMDERIAQLEDRLSALARPHS